MATITRDYIAIPKETYIKIQRKINISDVLEEEKIEFGFISESNLSEEQKKQLKKVKKMEDSELRNELHEYVLKTADELIVELKEKNNKEKIIMKSYV